VSVIRRRRLAASRSKMTATPIDRRFGARRLDVATKSTNVPRPSAMPRGEKKLAKPYLYPTKASTRGAQMSAALGKVSPRLKPGNPPRRISWSVPVRFCQFFLAPFRLRRSRDVRAGVRRRGAPPRRPARAFTSPVYTSGRLISIRLVAAFARASSKVVPVRLVTGLGWFENDPTMKSGRGRELRQNSCEFCYSGCDVFWRDTERHGGRSLQSPTRSMEMVRGNGFFPPADGRTVPRRPSVARRVRPGADGE